MIQFNLRQLASQADKEIHSQLEDHFLISSLVSFPFEVLSEPDERLLSKLFLDPHGVLTEVLNTFCKLL